MNRIARSIGVGAIALAAVFALVGCTPSPQQTCDKLKDLAEKDKKKVDNDKCLKFMNELKDRDADDYKCAAKTVKSLSSYDTAQLAIMVCDKSGRKKDK